jgi:peptidoglycan hydrolase CwlO-like protein
LQRLAQSGIPVEESSGGPANQEFEELKETVSRLQEEIKEIRGMIDSIRSRIS